MGLIDARKELAKLRAATDLSVAAFGRRAQLNRVTIDRVEDVKTLPDYEPDYVTVRKWLIA